VRFNSMVSYLLVTAGTLTLTTAAQAQQALDHSDSTLARDQQPRPMEEQPEPNLQTEVEVTSAPLATGQSGVFVGAITISGLQELTPADFADILNGRVGRHHSAAELSALATMIAKRMHARGYAFGSAWIERQRVSNGVLVVRVDEGRIDEVRFDGPHGPAVRRALEPLMNRKPIRVGEVERRLLLAGDIEGARIRGSRFVREGGRGVLLVSMAKDRATFRASLSNAGTRPIGPEQARIEVNLNGLFASDDSLTMIYSTTPAQPPELQFGYIRYEKRISPAGTEIGFIGSVSSTRPGSYLTPLNIRNRSWYAAATMLQPLLRRRKASFWLQGEFGVRNVAQWRGPLRVRDDQLAVGRLTLYGYTDVAGGRLRASAALSQGLDILGANRPGDLLSSRWEADGTFTAGTLWTDWTKSLGGNFSLRLAAQGQLSSQPLLISEEISLGGTAFLRGYDWGERSGDEGVMGSAELRYMWNEPLNLAKRAQVYAFFDGGSVSNQAAGLGGGALASAGGGVRMDLTSKLGANLELGVPLSGIRYDTGDKTPKLSFGLTTAF
jgi:hemolysin activation/secretion protein